MSMIAYHQPRFGKRFQPPFPWLDPEDKVLRGIGLKAPGRGKISEVWDYFQTLALVSNGHVMGNQDEDEPEDAKKDSTADTETTTDHQPPIDGVSSLVSPNPDIPVSWREAHLQDHGMLAIRSIPFYEV